jgi:hypothetical protein
MADTHTIATFAFTQMRRDPAFRAEFPWVRNTVVCVATDRVDDVLSGQMARHFPDGGTIACYYPEQHLFMFLRVDAPGRARGGEHVGDGHYTDDGRLVMEDTGATMTIGTVVDAVYQSRHEAKPSDVV